MSLQEMIGEKGRFKIIFMYNSSHSIYEGVGTEQFKNLYGKATFIVDKDTTITILAEIGKNVHGKSIWKGCDI